MRRTFSFFIGTILGGLIGAIIALLFAPVPGAELRVQISDRANNIVTDVRQASNTKRIELQERIETLRAPKA
ncbi:MAG: YtxH domain-containing protein [Chloroflexota bacterium]